MWPGLPGPRGRLVRLGPLDPRGLPEKPDPSVLRDPQGLPGLPGPRDLPVSPDPWVPRDPQAKPDPPGPRVPRGSPDPLGPKDP